MSKPTYTLEEIEQIAETDDADTIQKITELVHEEHDLYNLYDKGRIWQILSPLINNKLKDINNDLDVHK